ncbi:MAG: phage tail sheath subtilisin-like domain-containing protein [Lysobacter sp.]|nr:phage tail sheath subtilisin-like domain-containing protein [Lysobacter sp.]
MAEYLHPGVYVEEKSSGVRPIEGVGTSTAAFVGATAKGIPNKATFVTTWRSFVTKFGDVTRDGPYLPYAVEQFFNNGGKRCYIVRALSDASSRLASTTLTSRETSNARSTLTLEAKGKGAWGNSLSVLVDDGSSNPTGEFKLVVLYDGELVELFDNLSMDPNSENYVETAVNDASEYIQVSDLNAAMPLAYATAMSTAALADPVVPVGDNNLRLSLPDGTAAAALDLAAIPNTAQSPRTPQVVVDAINAAWGQYNLTASIVPATEGADAGKLRVRHNAAGFDQAFSIGANAGIAGMNGAYRGAGAAIGGTLLTAAQPTFNIAAPNNIVSFSLNGNAVGSVTLTAGAARTLEQVRSELATAFANATFGNQFGVRLYGSRLMIFTTNIGANNSTMLIGGTGAPTLGLVQMDGSAQPGGGVAGLGSSEAAFVQSNAGPFTVESGANLSFFVNNDADGSESAAITVTFNTGLAFPNLQQVTADQLAAAINTAAAGAVAASVVNGRVIVRQSRRGSFHSLRVQDGLHSPNIRIGFDTQVRTGYADGSAASPYFRPNFHLVANINEPWTFAGGDDGSPITNCDLLGTADKKTGLHALDDVSDVNFVAIPGASDPAVVGAALGYCGTRQDCFFIADTNGKRTKDTPITEPVHAQDYMRNKVSPKNSYGALYYPWLEIADRAGAGKNPKRFVPPSGFIAGLYARIDNSRGVWKAPAGTETGLIGPIGLEYSTTDAEQDILNPIGVNCIRQFPDSGIVVWGARTFAAQSDPEYRYVPVRRYTLYLRQSIYRGTQWSVFEPNDKPLWDQLRANIDDFMMGEFRKGALAGATPDEAFSVKCDEELNPPSEVNAGRLNMEISFAPLKPAEFVIIRISQKSQRPQG